MFFKKKQGKTQQRPAMAPIAAEPVDHGEPSYLGRDAMIEGQISCDGEIHVDGTIRGSLRAQVCVIDAQGVIQGEVTGDVVHVRGRVIGPIQGSQVYIHSGAHVEGDVFHDAISIEPGAYVYGTVRHNSTQPRSQSAFQPPLPLPPVASDTAIDSDPPAPLSEKDKLLNRLRLVQSKK